MQSCQVPCCPVVETLSGSLFRPQTLMGVVLRNVIAKARFLVDESLAVARSCVLLRPPRSGSARRLELTELEDRILLSAAPAGMLAPDAIQSADLDASADLVHEAALDCAAPSATLPDSSQRGFADFDAEAGSTDLGEDSCAIVEADEKAVRQELVVVDTGVADYQSLVDDLTENGRGGRPVDIVFLDGARDGIEQIGEVLAQYDHLDAVHVVSHATDRAVKLGATWLSIDNLDAYSGELARWGGSLDNGADMLFYGCDLAGSDSGRALVESLGTLTGADVAASVDNTGHAQYGGDWELEFSTGPIETTMAFSHEVQENWDGLLATITVTQTTDIVNGTVSSVAALIGSDGGDGISLREAILAVNNGSGGDVILIDPGTYTLSFGSAGEDAAAGGDLDILKDVTITGAGAATTVIDGNGIDRVFEVVSGTVSITDVAVQGGAVASDTGGGLHVRVAADVTVSRAVFTGNSAQDGGAIANHGILSLDDVTIDNNSADQAGGGLMNQGTATLLGVTISDNTCTSDNGGGIHSPVGDLSATNVTISGNSTPSDGGGIHSDSIVTLQNVTITNNTAAGGSGFFAGAGATVTVRNTIIAANNTSADIDGPFTSLGNNLIGNRGTVTDFVDGTNGDQVGDSGSPLDPLLGGLQNSGGFTSTHALLVVCPL